MPDKINPELGPVALVKESELRAADAAGRKPRLILCRSDCGCEVRWDWDGNAPSLVVDFCVGHRRTEHPDGSFGRMQIGVLSHLRRQAQALADFLDGKVDEMLKANGIIEYAKQNPKFIPFARKVRR